MAVFGLENVRPNAKGVLTIHHGDVKFQSGAFSTQVHSTSISEVSVDQSSRKLVGGKAGTVVKFAAPFGTGTLISLLREAVDVVAIKYSDADGGLHGAVFALPKGQASAVKEGLIAGEARRSMPVQCGVAVQARFCRTTAPSGPSGKQAQVLTVRYSNRASRIRACEPASRIPHRQL